MRFYATILCIIFQVSAIELWAQNALLLDDIETTDTNYLHIGYDNDTFANQDYGNSQNIHLEFVSQALNKIRLHSLFSRQSKPYNTASIGFHHTVYTPQELGRSEIQFGDYPYAGAWYLSLQTVTKNPNSKTTYASALHLGYIGPLAGGKGMQTTIHKTIGAVLPKGWHNQIESDLLINASFSVQRKFARFLNQHAEINGFSKINLGTLLSSATLGAQFKIGHLRDNENTTTPTNKTKFYGYYLPSVNAIAYDASLQGGAFSESDYTIHKDDVKNIVFVQKFAFCIAFKTVDLHLFHYRYSELIKDRGSKYNGGFALVFKL